ncbi:MAG: hypothetical protein ACRYF3_15680, partial [Janthinobacterium lividum]
ADVVEALTGRLEVSIGGSRSQRSNRLTALGALSGAAAGVGVGAAFGLARRAGVRLPAGVGGVLTGAAAMAATDLPAAALGVTDLRKWTSQDWISDAVPHLVYGFATHSTLQLLDPSPAPGSTAVVGRPSKPSARLLARATLLGVAAGGRGSLGLAGPALTSGSVPAELAGIAGLGFELVMDKNPKAPSRLAKGGLPLRIASGVGGGVALARRDGVAVLLPGIAGALGSTLGSFGGACWRAWAGARRPDWQGAVAEDIVAVTLAVLASRR